MGELYKSKAKHPADDDLDQAYQTWHADQTPESMNTLLGVAQPTLNTAVQSYGGNNPMLNTRAKILAADAFRTYDPTKGVKLRSHLMTQMQPLMRHHREYTSVTKVPERVAADSFRMSQEQKRFFDENGRDPSDNELADLTGMPIRRLNHIRKFNRVDMAESAFVDDEGAVVQPGTQKPDPTQVWIEYVHHDLDPIGQQILAWKTGFNGAPILENQEIARRLRLSPGAVSQRSAKIAARLAEMEEALA